MSRSYGKSSKGRTVEQDWHGVKRARKRLIIHRVMTYEDYDDVIFPAVSEVSDSWRCDRYNGYYVFKRKIRNKYFLEIRNILNGYSEDYKGRFDEMFMEEFKRIKGIVPDDGRKFSFEWLNLKAVRKVIRDWEGEPSQQTAFEVLRYLNRKGFIDLLGRTPQYNYERGMIGDMCDFVLEKMADNKKQRGKNRAGGFSFSGRTITSVIKLTNEWHDFLRREGEARRQQRNANFNEYYNRRKTPNIDTSKWKGMGIAQFRHETDEFTWTITELRTAQDLLNEGRKMKNCIASYAYRCACGEKAIFTVEKVYPVSQIIEKAASLEVLLPKNTLVQAKGKCNSAITPKVTNIITRWACANGITVRLQV